MKRIFVVFSIFITAQCLAQTPCSRNAPLFSFDNANVGNGKEITTLGSDPEYTFLRNMASPEQVYVAIKKNDKRNGPLAASFNTLMMQIGFANGTKDLNVSSITETRIPYGTEGNMGSGGGGLLYCKLATDPNGTKAWKISSGGVCYTYILAKCGNAFYPNTPKTACIDVPVNMSGDPKEVTLESAPAVTTTDKVFVYYHRRRHSKRALAPEFADVPDANASNPILLSRTDRVETMPQTYKVSLGLPQDQNDMMVCPDSTLNVSANVNVEKESEFAGYYPAKAKKNYKEVSKRSYKKIARKMRKAERKENRVARLTGTPVNVPENG